MMGKSSLKQFLIEEVSGFILFPVATPRIPGLPGVPGYSQSHSPLAFGGAEVVAESEPPHSLDPGPHEAIAALTRKDMERHGKTREELPYFRHHVQTYINISQHESRSSGAEAGEWRPALR